MTHNRLRAMRFAPPSWTPRPGAARRIGLVCSLHAQRLDGPGQHADREELVTFCRDLTEMGSVTPE